MKIMFKIILLAVSFVISSFTNPQPAEGVKTENVIAVYLYNFTKFFDWKEDNSEFFTIIVLGKSKITESLFKIASKEKVKGKSIVVNEISDLYSIDFCNILFLPTSNKDVFNDTLKKTKGKKVLIVTNSEGFAEKGAGINFLQIDNKIKFEINRKVLNEKGIVPNSSLLSLAYKIYE
jgi:hypothetical protein